MMNVHKTSDMHHAQNGSTLYSFNRNLYNLSCASVKKVDNKIKFIEVIHGSKSHMPKDSFFYEKVVPVSLAIMGIVTLGLVVFAAGVLLGLVKF